MARSNSMYAPFETLPKEVENMLGEAVQEGKPSYCAHGDPLWGKKPLKKSVSCVVIDKFFLKQGRFGHFRARITPNCERLSKGRVACEEKGKKIIKEKQNKGRRMTTRFSFVSLPAVPPPVLSERE